MEGKCGQRRVNLCQEVLFVALIGRLQVGPKLLEQVADVLGRLS